MPNHQAIICSYRKDFPWLTHCLVSLRKFAHGYLPPVICVDSEDVAGTQAIVRAAYPEATIWVQDGRPGQGFMRAQIAMMSADIGCPNADVIHFIGSDCIAIGPYNASEYADHEGKPYVLYTPYSQFTQAIPWKAGAERVLGVQNVEYEFMRRLPSVLPKSIFSPMRAHVEKVHGMGFADYIYAGDAAHRNTSEANALGAYAYYFMPESCHWVPTSEYSPDKYPNYLGQHWSHGGLDRPTDACYDYVIRGKKRNSFGRTPRSLIDEIVYDRI